MSKTLIWNVVEISTYLIETIITFMFLRDFLGKKPMYTFLKLVCPIVFIILLISIHMLITNAALVITCLLIIIFGAAFLFGGSLKHKMLAALLLTSLFLMSELLTMFSIMSLSKVNAQSAIEQGTLRLTGIIMSKIILLILIKCVFIFTKRREYVQISISYWLALFSVPLISIIAIYAIFSYNMMVDYTRLSPVAAISVIGLMISNIAIFYLFDEINEKSAIKSKYDILERQIESHVKQFEALDISNKNLTKIKHDINNHLICIKSFIENSSPEAVNYINNLTKSLNNTQIIDTGNYIIDSLLNAKIALAENSGITVSKIIQIPIGLKIDDVDSCILFGNVLDNAIEACNRISDGDKEIFISLAKSSNALICHVKNSTDGQVKRKGNLFYSSKRSSNELGIGLENIYNTIEKYNGIINIEHEGNIFELSFMIQGV